MLGTVFEPPLGASEPARNLLASFAATVRRRASAPALRARVLGAWRPLSWSAWAEGSREIAAGLAALGVRPGDRVALLGEGSTTWAIAELGIARLGAISVPLPTSPAPELELMLRDAGVEVLFVEPTRAGRLVGVHHPLRLRIGMPADGATDERAGDDVASWEPWESLRRRGRRALDTDADLRTRIDDAAERIAPDDPLTILYTAGTTGSPRGVMLRHGGAVWQGDALARAAGVGPNDEQLLVLPPSQVFARAMLWGAMAGGVVTSFGDAAGFERDVAEVAPTFFAAVPELLERIALRWQHALPRAAWAAPAVERALEVGRRASVAAQRGESLSLGLSLRRKLADRLLFAPMRARLGDRLRFIACGGAPLSRELAEFFHAAGVLVLEGYGLTEAGGVVTWNRPERYRFGTVGQALPGCELALDPDGELRVKCPSLATPLGRDAELDDEGFLRTGDVAELQQGFVRLFDRKRDVIKTTGGKSVAPAKIETRLRGKPGIAHALVVGPSFAEPGRELVALVDVDERVMMEISEREGLGCRSRADLASHPRIRQLLWTAIAEVNDTLPRHEHVSDFAVLPEPLRASAGELTAGGTLRRAMIARRHASLLAGLQGHAGVRGHR